MIKKLLKNKKGEIQLTYMITMLFLFWVLMLIIDVFRLSSAYLEVIDLIREVTEIAAVQGGYEEEAPEQYPVDGLYVTAGDVTRAVREEMNTFNITRGDVTFVVTEEVGGVNTETSWVLGSDTTGFRADYGSDITVRVRFAFDFLSLPEGWTNGNMVFRITRNTKSQYKHRDTGWVGDNL